MAEICIVVPQIDGEDSILYKKLLKYTKSRPLTNYLYALSIQEPFIQSMGTSGLNSQREPDFEKVIQVLNVDDMLDVTTQIHNAELQLHALEGSDYKIYNTVDEIIDRVLNFNDNNDNIVASIYQKDKGFIIQVTPKNDTNFNRNTFYRSGQQQLDLVLNELNSLGLDTYNLSDLSKLALNQLKVRDFVNTIKKYQAYNNKSLRADETSLLLELFRNNPIVQRFSNMLGDDLVEGFRFLLSESSTVPQELAQYSDYLISQDTRLKFNNLKAIVKSAFDNIDTTQLNTNLWQIYNGVQPEQEKQLKSTLKDLYEKYNLDKDTIQSISTQINTLNELNVSIISRLRNGIEILKKRGGLTQEAYEQQKERVSNLENRLQKKEYAASLLSYLQETAELLQLIQDTDVSFIQGQNLQENVIGLNNIARTLLETKEELDRRSFIIQAMTDMNSIQDITDEDLTQSDIDQIQTVARQVSGQFTSIQNQYRKKQFSLVYDFLKMYWGEESKEFQSFQISLKDALEVGNINMNIFDRYVLAMTEVQDPILATFGQTIKSMHEIRDAKLRDTEFNLRVVTEKLYKSGGDSKFIYEDNTDDKGNTHIRLLSEIDWNAYYKARKEHLQMLKSKGWSDSWVASQMVAWDEQNQGEYKMFIRNSKGERQEIIISNVPSEKYRKSINMNQAQKEYYEFMMGMKYELEKDLEKHGVKTNLFMPIQLTSEISDALANASPEEAYRLLRDNFIDKFKIREDDTQFGELHTLVDAEGNEVKGLPVFYMHQLKDQRRLNRDFSKCMMNFASMAINHSTMADRIYLIELTKDHLLERPVKQSIGNKAITQITDAMGNRVSTPVVRKSRETQIKGWLDDIVDAKFYGKKHEKTGSTLGINRAKLTDLATSYTSVTGLTMNMPGAIANALVGKIQMIIEAGGGEFFGFKSMVKAEKDYWALLPELLGELYSNNKKSKLALLMDRFDAQDEFYQRLKETGFYKHFGSKIIGNTNLFFLYGMGEHLLHAQGMLAVLEQTKVKKVGDTSNKTYSLLEALDVETEGSNGRLIIKEGFVDLNGREINDEFLDRQRNVIQYVNRSMHGAFGDDEKGAIHRYAIGRLIMNFRQWMPAHYARRFNTLHWDAQLGDFREGYYVSTAKFVWGCLKDMKQHQFTLITKLNQLRNSDKAEDKMVYANLKRTLTEVVLLGIFTLLARMDWGDDPKNRTWAQSMLKYQIKRINLEIGASSPANMQSFVKNIYKTFNEPAAALAQANRFTTLFGIDDLILMRKVQSGPHEGELVYVRNIERLIPFYDQVWKWWNMDEDNSMFVLFNK